MPDPLEVLPNEIWSMCMEKAIDGQVNGLLEYLSVSTTWQRLLLDTSSLWTQIYIQNTDDELARISVFLLLSKTSSLHVDIMTVHLPMDSMRLISENISRVIDISIRPGPSATSSELHAGQWKPAASSYLAMLSCSLLPSDLARTSCYGISLRENGHLHYRIVLVHLAMINTAREYRPDPAGLFDTESYFRIWDEHLARCALATLMKMRNSTEYWQSAIHLSADEDSRARTSSIASIADLIYHGGPFAIHNDICQG